MNMKKYWIFLFALAPVFVLATGCAKEKLSPESIITERQAPKNEFDKWLDANFVKPYNIDFKYRFESNESDLNYYTIPADYESAVIMAHLVKYLCIDTYVAVGGEEFTKRYFPKMFFLIGEWEYRNNGVYVLGTAESGKKILLAGINYLSSSLNSASTLNARYFKTVHHEFTHILNQTRDYPKGFREVTGTTYVSDSWNAAPFNAGYLQRGYITAYAQHSSGEDIAELLSVYVTNTEDWWNNTLETAGKDGEPGAKLIRTKMDFVKSYMKDSFNIDLDKLRDEFLLRQAKVVAGEIDLTSLTL